MAAPARKTIYAPAALRDLHQARRWLRQPGAGHAAGKRLRAIRASLHQLQETPCRWLVGDHPGVRELPVEGYRIMDKIDPDTGENQTAGHVTVLRVFGPHQRRDDF